MSYHTQQNTQQKSLGFFFVIAFHGLLIAGLLSGLGVKIIPHPTRPDHVQIIQEKFIPEPLVVPVDPDPLRSFDKQLTLPKTKLPPIDFEKPVDPTDRTIIPQQDGGIVSQVPTITKPKLIKASKPEYPSASTRLGEEGKTGLSLLVTADGRVTEVQLISTSGSDRLDAAAIKHAQHNWAFSPCAENGVAVACRFQATLVWRLDEAHR